VPVNRERKRFIAPAKGCTCAPIHPFSPAKALAGTDADPNKKQISSAQMQTSRNEISGQNEFTDPLLYAILLLFKVIISEPPYYLSQVASFSQYSGKPAFIFFAYYILIKIEQLN
jgi:hypothetical protein